MSQLHLEPHKHFWFSLPLRISIGLVLAAIIPLMIMLGFIGLQTRPALINQANDTMISDTQTHVQLIDTYFKERSLDAKTLTQVTSVQEFLTMPVTDDVTYQTALAHVGYALKAGMDRSSDYAYWALFDKAGNLHSSFPSIPPKHGKAFFTHNQLQSIQAGQEFISPVYYSPSTRKASVDIYAPIWPVIGSKTQIIGFLRATLNLTTIENIVQQNTNSHGKGSYAFILDDNGIRIVDTNAQRRFTSVAPIDSALQQQISNERRFGNTQPIKVLADPDIANSIKTNSQMETFQAQPAGQTEKFQIVRHAASVVPWQYFVLSPVNVVTDAANKQMLDIVILACVASLIVAIAGIFVGRGISRPILQAVENLRENSQALSTLATNQQSAASEQIWVVDSSQIGLQSVQYYTDATRIALHQLKDSAVELKDQWQHRQQIQSQQIEQVLERIIKAANYIENATEYQYTSNQKLATALKVATQVTEQLHTGATSATEAATKLEEVVQELRLVVGH